MRVGSSESNKEAEAARAARQPGVSGRRGRRRQHPQDLVEAAKCSRQVLGVCGQSVIHSTTTEIREEAEYHWVAVRTLYEPLRPMSPTSSLTSPIHLIETYDIDLPYRPTLTSNRTSRATISTCRIGDSKATISLELNCIL